MQVVLELLKHAFVAIAIFGHTLLLALVPQVRTEPAQNRPIGLPAEQEGFKESQSGTLLTSGSASATASTTQTRLFPVAAMTKPASTPTSAGKSTATSTLKQNLVAPPQAATKSSAQAKPPAQTTQPVTLLPQSIINDASRAALVNIFCKTKTGGYLYPISGSGVLITKNGVILTNAHVGQYFLLRDYPVPGNVDCIVRTGSPAQATYQAELLYLPPAWIDANASQIIAQESMGTGQDDYSFLRITSPINTSASLPATFPALPMTTDDPSQQEPVLLASYPAGFLSGITIETNLYISTVLTQVADVFAFDHRGYADLLSLGGSLVAQAGSSGGAVVRQQDGALQGIIATETASSTTTSTSARDLHAITLGHIDRSLQEEGVGGIASLLTGDIQAKANGFANNTAPAERKKLVDFLNKR